MATTAAHTAAPAHRQQAHRPLSRIVPAIPHRLARAAPPAARPTTPERASKGAAPEPTPQQQPEPEPQAEDKKDAAVVDTPLTPDSRISGVDKGEIDASAPVQFPPTPQEESAVDSTEEQSASQAGPTIQAASASRESAEGQVNGHGKKIDTEAATAHLESAPAANRARRKLTIPAQLPPAFVPSSKPHTPAPSAEISDAPKVPYHRHQLSAGAVVFKSANGSPATPATPQEFDHDAHHHNEQLGSQPPPGFVPLQYIDGGPASFQHLSEAGASWVHPAHRIAAPDHVYGNGTEYGSPRYVDGMNAQPDSQDNRHPAGDTTLATNGSATPHSQSPSKTQFGRLQPASDYSEEHRGPQYHNGTSHPVEPVDHSPFELAAYLSTQFGNPDFADFVLQIRSPESALVSIPVHGIVVSRSPVIEAAVRRSPAPSHRSPNARRLIDVMTLDPHITRESLEEAVKVLYGSPLLLPQNIFFGLGPYAYEADARSSDARRRMQQVISYIAAAKALQIGSMQARGVEISRMLLRWDTVDQLLSYGLQVGSARKEMDPEDVLGPTLVHCVVEFIAYTFPVDFKLHTIAPEMHEVPRLPIVLESRPPMHNPRLSKIRFGDAPTGDNASHSPVDKILSTLLFSLPAPLLDLLFNHPAIANQIGWTGAMKLLGDVVAERENRRLKALRGQLKSAQDGTVPAALLDNMYTEEQLEQYPAHPSGYRLVTKRSVAGG